MDTNRLVQLARACKDKDLQSVKQLVKARDIERYLNKKFNAKEVSTSGDYQLTVLHVACEFSTALIVTVLLKHGARSDVKDEQDNLPIHLASTSEIDAAEKIEALLKVKKEHVYETGYLQRTPLHKACRLGTADAVNMLLNHGARCDAKDKQGNLPIHLASLSKIEEAAKIKALIKMNKENIHKPGCNQRTPLHIACQQGTADAVQLLMDHGARSNVKDKYGQNPIELASGSEIESAEKVRILTDQQKPTSLKTTMKNDGRRDVENQVYVVPPNGKIIKKNSSINLRSNTTREQSGRSRVEILPGVTMASNDEIIDMSDSDSEKSLNFEKYYPDPTDFNVVSLHSGQETPRCTRRDSIESIKPRNEDRNFKATKKYREFQKNEYVEKSTTKPVKFTDELLKKSFRFHFDHMTRIQWAPHMDFLFARQQLTVEDMDKIIPEREDRTRRMFVILLSKKETSWASLLLESMKKSADCDDLVTMIEDTCSNPDSI